MTFRESKNAAVRRILVQTLLQRSALKRVARSVIESLEPRQLLSGVVTTYPIPGADPSSWDGSTAHLVAGPDGNVWFTDPTNNAIGKVTPAGVVTEFPLPVHNAPLDDGSGGVGPDDPSPSDIVVGPNGNLWFTETGVDRIGEITTAGQISEFRTPTADSNPVGIAAGSDGDLWFAESNNNAIGRITPAGKVTEFPLQSLDVSSVDGIVKGPDGKIWFIADDSNGNGALASISSSGTVSSISLSIDPTALAVGPDGNFWVGASDGEISQVTPGGTITTFTLPDGAYVNSIRPADGKLWLALDGSNQLASITTAGAMAEFSLPADATNPAAGDFQFNDISPSADGSLWFVDAYNPQVGTVNLSGALLASGLSVTVTAGASTTSTFASFTDFSGPASASDYSATLTLPDGSTLPASVAANASGGFDVTATNAWPIGYDDLTVTITDTRDSTRVATAQASIYATAPQAVGTGVDVTAASGQEINAVVATFSNVLVADESQYSATIDWGDGHDTAGVIAVNPQGTFDVSGTNRYAQAGSYTITTWLSPYGGGVIDPGGPVIPINRPVGVPVPVTPGGGGGTASPGATSGSGGTATGFLSTIDSSRATHVFPPAAIAVPIGLFGDQASATATIAPGVMDGLGYSVQASSKTPFNGTVANFTLADPSADTSHFHATITWSDPGIRDWWFTSSNAPSAGIITPDGNGGFNVATTASFSNSGLFHFVVTITDDRITTGDSTVGVAYGQIIVDSPIIWLPVFDAHAPVATPGATADVAANGAVATDPVLAEKVKGKSAPAKSFAGQMFDGNVGILSGVKSSSTQLADLHGTVNWGDGTTSAATFASGRKGLVSVRGDHVYSEPGKYSISVDVTQTLLANGQPSSLYPLHLPTIESQARIIAAKHARPISTGGIAIIATAGVEFAGNIATFPAPAAPAGITRSAIVSWGDHSHAVATISTDSNNMMTISASHVYRKPGRYKVKIEVTQKAGPGVTTKVQKILANIQTTATVSGQ